MNNSSLYAIADEGRLLELVAAGSGEAFRVLFDRYFDLVYSTALRYAVTSQVAEDVAQQVFLKIWEKRAGLIDIRQIEPYLFTAAKRAMLQDFRKQATQRDYISHVIEVFGEARDRDPESILISKEQVNQLQVIIAQLPARQQEAFRLSRDAQLSYSEIASRMGISRETVKEYISQVLKKLRNHACEHPDLLMIIVAFLVG